MDGFRRTLVFGGLMAGGLSLVPGRARSDRAAAAAASTGDRLRALGETAGLEPGAPAFIRIFKREAVLELFLRHPAGDYRLLESYGICRYSGDLGPKLREGDGQAPEGFYYVTPARMNPHSRFHLSFDLGYPNAYDRAHERTGSFLMVHGSCVSIGCYAMTDRGIEEIYTVVAAAHAGGQRLVRVHAFPFRLTAEALAAEADGRWYDFWHNLKEGYDFFEQHRLPPNVEVRERRYVFETAA